MQKICHKCLHKLEVKTTSIQSGFGNLKLHIEGITVYVCPYCGDTTMESTDALVLQKLSETLNGCEEKKRNQSLIIKEEKREILTLSEVASLLRVSHQTIYNMIKDGRLKGYKVGREWRFIKKDIDTYLLPEKSQSIDHFLTYNEE
ncbi:MAG: helix-turn-helix domain-containing protein [Turicibacter sp.]|nr:helix-turn-helix domain-containing protein [Turicibacter sp.]